MIETIRFKNDTLTRKRLMVPDSFQHPAKGQLGMWALMIEKYSKPGETILDPMSGSGATLLAALMGRNVVCVELEQHFVDPMRRSWEKMRQHPMLGFEMGQVCILRGDARCLPVLSADTIITSPPYENLSFSGDTAESQASAEAHFGRKFGPAQNPRGYTRPVADVILTSPPYEGSAVSDLNASPLNGPIGDASRQKDKRKGGNEEFGKFGIGYTRPVDAIVTSPPYADQVSSPTHGIDMDKRGHGDGGIYFNTPFQYGKAGNIGNQRGDAYWDSMRQVYAECWRVLRPGGIMALVLKGFTRDGKYVDLPGQTEAMLLAMFPCPNSVYHQNIADGIENAQTSKCDSCDGSGNVGWVKHDEWRRQLWSLSFWRILQKRRSPETWDERLGYESVLAFRKPEGLRRSEVTNA